MRRVYVIGLARMYSMSARYEQVHLQRKRVIVRYFGWSLVMTLILYTIYSFWAIT